MAYDDLDVRRVLMELPTRLMDGLEEHKIEVDPRVLMALQSMCFSAIAHLDSCVIDAREVDEMNQAFKAFNVTEETKEEI